MTGENSGTAIPIAVTLPHDNDKVLEKHLLRSYGSLRALAQVYLRHEPFARTLEPTSLVHEAYVHLVRQRVEWNNRDQFCAIAAIVMRRVLVKHAQRRRAQKRGGGRVRVMLDAAVLWCEEQCGDLTGLDEALNDLAGFAPRQARIVALRFFGGMAMDEIAHVMDIGERTVHRDWAAARAWLRGRLTRDDWHEPRSVEPNSICL